MCGILNNTTCINNNINFVWLMFYNKVKSNDYFVKYFNILRCLKNMFHEKSISRSINGKTYIFDILSKFNCKM